jgi:fructose-specific phosphotransferase system IIC component
MLELLTELRKHLLTGASFVIPFITGGGTLIAAAIAFAAMTPTGPDFSHAPRLKLLLDIGTVSLTLMLAVLAGYISCNSSVVTRPRRLTCLSHCSIHVRYLTNSCPTTRKLRMLSGWVE